jgi:hypothetical protein
MYTTRRCSTSYHEPERSSGVRAELNHDFLDGLAQVTIPSDHVGARCLRRRQRCGMRVFAT